MAEPRVSIVIPAFNGLAYLIQAYESVRAQTYSHIEICITDGGSTDGTERWIRTLPNDVRTDELPIGTSAARNWTRVTEIASGAFIKLLCQDDILYPDAVALQVADLMKYPSAQLAAARRDVISASGKLLYRNRGLNGVRAGLVHGSAILQASYISGTNVLGEPHTLLFRRQALLDAMPWDAARPYLLDLDTYSKILDRPECDVVVRKDSICAFRVSTSSWSTRLMTSQKDQLRAWQREYEEGHRPGSVTRRRASLGLTTHSIVRRFAYAWLRAKGDMG